jgi:hypothetical protein
MSKLFGAVNWILASPVEPISGVPAFFEDSEWLSLRIV